jgi:hypothetical protein
MIEMLIFILILSLIAIIVIALVSYRTIKIVREERIKKQQDFYNRSIDILNLDYIFVTDKRSGLNLYTQNFSSKENDASLISGFLQAIHSFGMDLNLFDERAQPIRLEYRNSIILICEFVNLRLILIMKEEPSRSFVLSVEELAYDIYKTYGDHIDNFNGDIKPFKGIEELIKLHLKISFIYPLKSSIIEQLNKIKLSRNERDFVNNANDIFKRFQSRTILTQKEKDWLIELFKTLMKKKNRI